MKTISQGDIDRLVKETQRGNKEAFGELYDIYFPQIYKYVHYKVAKEYVEDLVSTVFVKSWTNIGKYKKSSFPFSSWLFRIAHNAVVDHYRTHKEHYELEERLMDDEESTNPKHLLEKRLTSDRIQRALRTLDDKYQEVLQLKYMHDMSNRDIADVLKTNEANIRTMQFRALKKMRTVFEEEEKAAEALYLVQQAQPMGFLRRLFVRS